MAKIFDLETHLFRPGNMAPRPVCLSWAGTGGASGLLTGNDMHDWLGDWLATDEIMVCHNSAFDFSCSLAHWPDLASSIWQKFQRDQVTCTMVREKLLDIGRGVHGHHPEGRKWVHHRYSLAEIVQRRLGHYMDKSADTWRTRYASLENVPLADWPEAATKYALDDSIFTRDLYVNQEGRITSILPIPTQYGDTRADFALRLMSTWGIKVDLPRAQDLHDRLCDRMRELRDYLSRYGIVTGAELFERRNETPKSKKNMARIRELVLKHYPGPAPKTASGKSVATDKDTLKECDEPRLNALSEFNSVQTSLGNFVSKMLEELIHSRFDAVGGASDRTSSANPTLQNIPRAPGIRECFIPRDGRVFLACDYSAQEMRTLAQSCIDLVGFSRLAERFQANPEYDPHLEFGAKLMHIPLAEAQERMAARDKEVKKFRQRAKVGNFGFPGGMGPATLVQYARGYGVTMTELEAKSLKKQWYSQWPEMEQYFKHIRHLIGPAGVGVQKIPRSGFRRARCGYMDASNGYFQTLAAHASKAALFEVQRRCYQQHNSWLYGSRSVLFIHDEIILETLPETAHEAAGELSRVMVTEMEKWTPDVPSHAEPTLMRCWTKGAEQVFENGRLIPCD